MEHFLDNTLRGQVAGLCAGAVLKADGMAFINGSLDHIHAVGVFLDGVIVQVIGVGGDVLQSGQHANGDGVNEFNVVVRIIQVLDKGLADFGVLGVLPDDQRNVGGFGAVDGVAVGYAGQRSAADILGDLRGVVLHTADHEAGVEVKGSLALIEQRSVIVDRVVDGLGGRAVLVDFQPEVDAVDGFLAGQVGGQVIIQQAAAGTDNVIVQVAGAQQIVGAAGECCAILAVFGQGHCGIIELVPSLGDFQPGCFQQVGAVPHDLCVGVIRHTVGGAIAGHIGQRVSREAVAANVVNHIIYRGQDISVHHLNDFTGTLSRAHIGQVARCQAGIPLGVEVAPRVGLDVDLNAGVGFHKLIGGLLDGLHAGTLREGMPEGDLALQRRVGLCRGRSLRGSSSAGVGRAGRR